MKHTKEKYSNMQQCTVVESTAETLISENSALIKDSVPSVLDKSVGITKRAVVVGCNSNNDNASARTTNGNNAVSNSNDNYAGRFALPLEENLKNGKSYTARSARTNITEEATHTSFEEVMELLRCEYSTDSASESNANPPERDIWQELHLANKKRHLKNMKRFLVNREIVTAAVKRCFSHASPSPQREEAKKHKDEYIDRIIDELTNETYEVGKIVKRKLPKRGKDGKERNANIFSMYDRCVQNVVLLVIQEKIHNKFTRHIYSGIPERSLLSKNKRYCLISRLHDYCVRHPDDYVMMTDIRKFYESLESDIVLGFLYGIIYDRYLRILLYKILKSLPSLPIGGTLSQCCAMLVLGECDRLILEKFHPKFYCGFGDNRLFGDPDKQKLIKIKEFQTSYYAGRLKLDLKDDYSLHRIRNGFRFCRTDFNHKYVKIRSELKRRAIRGAIRGQQNYAGYKGFLLRTDSKFLRSHVENNLDLLRNHTTLINKGSDDLLDSAMKIFNSKQSI